MSAVTEQPLQHDMEPLLVFESNPAATCTGGTSRRRLLVVPFTWLAFLLGAILVVHKHRSDSRVHNPADTLNLAASGPTVYPVRILFFRHGFSCANAGHTAACADPDAPMLHLTAKDQEALYDKLDSIGAQLPAPRVIPKIDRSFGIQGRGKKYVGGRPPRPDVYRGDDCILHLHQWTDNPQKQWHEAGNVIQMRHYVRDPVLTKCSAFQSEKAGQEFRSWLRNEGVKLDFLGASVLTRTFQTAFHQLLMDNTSWGDIFTQEMLHGTGAPLVSQMPFLNEFNTIWGYQADDVAWPAEEQRQILENALGERAVRHLDYSHLEGFTHEERVGHDWEAFKEKVLGPRLLPFILKRKRESVSVPISVLQRARSGDGFSRAKWGDAARAAAGPTGNVEAILNIGMASHSGVIQESCRFASRSASNNAVVEMLLLVEVRADGSDVVVRQESGTCALVMDAPKQPDDLDRQDVENCVHPFDFSKAFVPRADGSSRTKCEEVALARDAYPTHRAAKLGR